MTVAEDVTKMSEQEYRAYVERRFQDGSANFKQLTEAMAENTAMTKANAEGTAELIELHKAAKRGISFFSTIGRGLSAVGRFIYHTAKFLWPIIAVAGALAAVAKGVWPSAHGE